MAEPILLAAHRMKAHLDVAIAAGRYIEAASGLVGRPFNPVRPDMLEAQVQLEDMMAGRIALAMPAEEVEAYADQVERQALRLSRHARFLHRGIRLFTWLLGDLREFRQIADEEPPSPPEASDLALVGLVFTLAITALWLVAR